MIKYQIIDISEDGWLLIRGGAYLIILCLEWSLIRGVHLIEALQYVIPTSNQYQIKPEIGTIFVIYFLHKDELEMKEGVRDLRLP